MRPDPEHGEAAPKDGNPESAATTPGHEQNTSQHRRDAVKIRLAKVIPLAEPTCPADVHSEITGAITDALGLVMLLEVERALLDPGLTPDRETELCEQWRRLTQGGAA